MSDTTVGRPAGLADSVAEYVREVRAELVDLRAEDVDDLTGGMEADLSELAAECGGDLAGRLGSPRLYAAELRAAAGVPERVAGSGPRRRRLTEAVAHARASFTMLADEHPWLGSVTAFLVTLRPAWWLLRGYLLALGVWSIMDGNMQGVRPRGAAQYVMAMVAIVVSVQLGRGWLGRRAALRPFLLVANTIAVIVALMALDAGRVSYDSGADNSGYGVPLGVSLDGQQLGNIYAYDSDGKRITGVRLFAEDGRPLDAGQSSTDANGNPVGLDANGIPADVVRDNSGTPLLNVYPRALGSDPWQVTDPADQQWGQQVWTPPMSIVPLTSSSPTPSSPTPTATKPATSPATAPTSKPVPHGTAPPTSSTSPTSSSGPSPSVTRSGR